MIFDLDVLPFIIVNFALGVERIFDKYFSSSMFAWLACGTLVR